MFDNEVIPLKRIFARDTDEVTAEWGQIYNQPYSLYSSQTIIRLINWILHLCRSKKYNYVKFQLQKRILRDLIVDGNNIKIYLQHMKVRVKLSQSLIN